MMKKIMRKRTNLILLVLIMLGMMQSAAMAEAYVAQIGDMPYTSLPRLFKLSPMGPKQQ